MARRLFLRTRLRREITIARSHREADRQDLLAWGRMTPRERLAAVELWRQMNHSNYDPDTARLPRVFEIVEPASR